MVEILNLKKWYTRIRMIRALPILDGVKPFLANLKMWSLTSSDDDFNHVGTLRRYGRADFEIPFLRTFKNKHGQTLFSCLLRWDIVNERDTVNVRFACPMCVSSRCRCDRVRYRVNSRKTNMDIYPGVCIRPMMTVVRYTLRSRKFLDNTEMCKISKKKSHTRLTNFT